METAKGSSGQKSERLASTAPLPVPVHGPTHAKLRAFIHLSAAVLVFYGAISFAIWWLFPAAALSSHINDLLLRPIGAILSVVGGASLECLSRRFESHTADRIGRLGGAVFFILGCLIMAFYASKGAFDIVSLVVPRIPSLALSRAHTPEVGAVFILMLGAGIMLIDWRWKNFQPSAWLLLILFSLCLLACFTDVYQLTALYFFPPSHLVVTMPRNVAVLLGSLALLFLQEDNLLVRALIRDSAGASLLRGLLPASILIPLILEWLRLSGQQHGLYGAEIGRAGMVVSMLLMVIVLIWLASQSLDKMEKARSGMARALHETESLRIEEMTRSHKDLALIAEQLALARDQALDSAKAKFEFLANMSHEIRTPMTAVISGSQLLESSQLTPEQTGLVSVILSAGEALLDIINNILCYAKLEAGGVELETIEFDLARLIETTIDLFIFKASEKNIVLTSYISPSLPTRMVGDPARLREILINVIGNAVKFTPSGQVVVRVQPLRIGASNFVQFSVSDSGIGIEKPVIERLFQPFIQADSSISRHYGGSGLGLSICKRLVELMHGIVQVQSQIKRGTTISVALPDTSRTPSQLQELAQDKDWCKQASRTGVLVIGAHSALAHELIRYLHRLRIDTKHTANMERARLMLGSCDRLRQLIFLTLDRATPDMFDLIKNSSDRENIELAIYVLCRNRIQRATARAALGSKVEDILCVPLKRDEILGLLYGRKDSSARTGQQKDKPAGVSGQGTLILVVEDSPVIRRLAVLQLSQLGCDVRTVGGGREAVDEVIHGNYALVFMDCQMPDIDGFTATSEIRKLEASTGKHTPIVAMTAQAMPGDRERCIEAGMDDYISKPVTRDDLCRSLTRWISVPRQESESGASQT